MLFLFFFFFSSRRRHTRLQGDWSSDVCSSDLEIVGALLGSSSPAPARRAPLRKSRREIGSLIPRRFSPTTRLWLQRRVRRACLESEPVRRERHTVGDVSKAVAVGRAELQLILASGLQRDPIAERRAR